MLVGVTIRPTFLPIGRDSDFLRLVFSLAIQSLVAAPSDTCISHLIGLVGIVIRLDIYQQGAFESIIEYGIGNKTTGVIGFPTAI